MIVVPIDQPPEALRLVHAEPASLLARSLVHTMAPLKRSVVEGVVCAIFFSHCAAFTLSPVPTYPSSSPAVAAEHVRYRPGTRSTRSRRSTTASPFLPDRRVDGLAGGSRVPGFALGRCACGVCVVLCISTSLKQQSACGSGLLHERLRRTWHDNGAAVRALCTNVRRGISANT